MDEPALEVLQRWEISGGHWRVLSRGSGRLVVSLVRCDGGEEAHRLTSTDADLAAYVGSRDASDD